MGDEDRFAALYAANARAVHGYVRRRAPDAAEDVAAETFLVAWRRLDRVPADALPWLLAVARRLLANEQRRRRRLSLLRGRLQAEPRPAIASSDRPEDSRVVRALARLSAVEYEAITLIAWEALSQDQAARVVGTTRSAFSMRLARARRKLERELGDAATSPDPHHLPEATR